jgi:hypothetical protein
MGLKDYKFGKRSVKTSGGELSVRGLNFGDITRLVREHTAEVVMLFGEAQVQSAKPVEDQDFTAFLAKAMHTAPKLVAAAIAAGLDEEGSENEAIIGKWPLGVQLALMEAVGEETFAVEGGLGKIIEIVNKIVKGTTDLRSNSGSTELDSK